MLTLEQVRARMLWWQSPDLPPASDKRLITQIMEYGNLADVQAMLKYFGEAEILDALERPLAGVFTSKSWHFWHIYFGKDVPPLPKRELPEYGRSRVSEATEL